MMAFIRDMIDVLSMRCEQHAVLVSRQADDPLRAGQACGLWLHLRMCKGCSQWKRHVTQLRAMLQAMNVEETATPPMPGAARERIARTLGAASHESREI